MVGKAGPFVDGHRKNRERREGRKGRPSGARKPFEKELGYRSHMHDPVQNWFVMHHDPKLDGF